MVVTSHQPVLFPPLYLLNRLVQADSYIVLVDAQFDREDMRCTLQRKNDKVTVSLTLNKPGRRPYAAVTPHDPISWKNRFLKTVQTMHGRSPYVQSLVSYVEEVFSLLPENPTAADIGFISVQLIAREIAPETQVIRSTDIMKRLDDPNKWLSALTKEIGGTVYFQGKRSMQEYFDVQHWSNIMLKSQVYCSPEGSLLDHIAKYSNKELKKSVGGGTLEEIWPKK